MRTYKLAPHPEGYTVACDHCGKEVDMNTTILVDYLEVNGRKGIGLRQAWFCSRTCFDEVIDSLINQAETE